MQYEGNICHGLFADVQIWSSKNEASGHFRLIIRVGLKDCGDETAQRCLVEGFPGGIDQSRSRKLVSACKGGQSTLYRACHFCRTVRRTGAQRHDCLRYQKQVTHSMPHLAHEERLAVLGQFSFANVPRNFRRANDRTVDILDWRYCDRHVNLLTVFPQSNSVKVWNASSLAERLNYPSFLFKAIRGDQDRNVLAESFLSRVTENPLGSRVPTCDNSIEGFADDGVVR